MLTNSKTHDVEHLCRINKSDYTKEKSMDALEEQMQEYRNKMRRKKVSREANNLVCWLLNPQTAKYPDAASIKRHDFFWKVDDGTFWEKFEGGGILPPYDPQAKPGKRYRKDY